MPFFKIGVHPEQFAKKLYESYDKLLFSHVVVSCQSPIKGFIEFKTGFPNNYVIMIN